MRLRFCRTLLFRAITSLLFLTTASFAQSNFSGLHGTVMDAGKQMIAGATVTLASQTTGSQRTVKTTDTGAFEFAGLLPGDYELRAEAPGFSRRVKQLRLEVGEQMNLDLPLQMGEVKEAIEVAANADLLKTTQSNVGEVIEPKSIKELPLN